MLKTSTLIRRKPGMSVTEFQRYWREVDGPIAAKVPGLRRYIQCHTLPSEYEREIQPDYDGVAEMWWDDLATFERAQATPEYKAMLADAANFAAETTTYPSNEVVLIDAYAEPRDRQAMVKYIAMLFLKQGVPITEFQRHWKDIHGPINVRNLTGMKRYVQAHILPSLYAGPDAPPFGGLPEAWFESVAAMRDAPRDPSRADQQWPDYCSGQRAIFTKEIVIIE